MIDCKKSKNHGWYDEALGCKWCPVPIAKGPPDWQAVLRNWTPVPPRLDDPHVVNPNEEDEDEDDSEDHCGDPDCCGPL